MNKHTALQKVEHKILTELSCPLKDAAQHMVFGKGNSNAKIFFIGEAPGKKEDEQGIPFVGRAGTDLDALLHTIGLSLEQVYIANILKYRPPKNRDPTLQEMQKHTPFLLEQIAIVNPAVIVPLGNFATKFMLAAADLTELKKSPTISIVHGSVHTRQIAGKSRIIFPVYHPAAMLYRPKLRTLMQEDFVKLQQLLVQKK